MSGVPDQHEHAQRCVGGRKPHSGAFLFFLPQNALLAALVAHLISSHLIISLQRRRGAEGSIPTNSRGGLREGVEFLLFTCIYFVGSASFCRASLGSAVETSDPIRLMGMMTSCKKEGCNNIKSFIMAIVHTPFHLLLSSSSSSPPSSSSSSPSSYFWFEIYTLREIT